VGREDGGDGITQSANILPIDRYFLSRRRDTEIGAHAPRTNGSRRAGRQAAASRLSSRCDGQNNSHRDTETPRPYAERACRPATPGQGRPTGDGLGSAAALRFGDSVVVEASLVEKTLCLCVSVARQSERARRMTRVACGPLEAATWRLMCGRQNNSHRVFMGCVPIDRYFLSRNRGTENNRKDFLSLFVSVSPFLCVIPLPPSSPLPG
jgi:hypothetical protein